MSLKRPLVNDHRPKAKSKRHRLTLDTKLSILEELETGRKIVDIASVHGLNESTIRTIKTNGDKIRASALAGISMSTSSITYSRYVYSNF